MLKMPGGSNDECPFQLYLKYATLWMLWHVRSSERQGPSFRLPG